MVEQYWPDWRIIRKIGSGSYGNVYEAERTDHTIKSRAAIKVISIPQNESELESMRSEFMSEENTRTYFNNEVEELVNEIKFMESFKQVQNIVSIEDYKVIDKPDHIGADILIRMDLLTPLSAYAGRKGGLLEEEAIRLGIDMCSALEQCERKNVIHRDIKPENIFVHEDLGIFILGDFGIARKLENMTGGMSLKGTKNYMAPEVQYSDKYDGRVDIYSLGLVLYRYLNGAAMPFCENAVTANEINEAHMRRMRGEPIPPPRFASKLMAEVILTACSYDPDARFHTASAMKAALLQVQNGAAELSLGTAGSVRNTQQEDLDATIRVRPTAGGDTSGGYGYTNNTYRPQPQPQQPVYQEPVYQPAPQPVPVNSGISNEPLWDNSRNFVGTQPVNTWNNTVKTKKKSSCWKTLFIIIIVCFLGSQVLDHYAKKLSEENESVKSYMDSGTDEEGQPTEEEAAAAAAPQAAFGEAPIELHFMPESHITKFDRIAPGIEDDYWIGNENWKTAFVYNAQSKNMGGAVACSEYLLEKKFGKLTFRLYPYLWKGFAENTTVKLLVYDPDTDEVLYENVVNSDSRVTKVNVDVNGRNKVDISLSWAGGGLLADYGCLFMKDAYLYPAGMEEELPVTVDTAQLSQERQDFGKEKIELHDVPTGFYLKSMHVDDRAEVDYSINSEIWRSAFIYKASEYDTAYADYLLDKKFNKLKFRVTPYLNGGYTESTVTHLTVSDADKDEVLYETDVTSAAEVLDVSVNVKGRKRIRITVNRTQGPLLNDKGYLLIKDAYLIPPKAKTESQADSAAENTSEAAAAEAESAADTAKSAAAETKEQ